MTLQLCECCGGEFSCRADSPHGCWCEEVVISARQLALLREHFLACLCPDCLLVATQERASGAAALRRTPPSQQ
jgi:hypothetical protein